MCQKKVNSLQNTPQSLQTKLSLRPTCCLLVFCTSLSFSFFFLILDTSLRNDWIQTGFIAVSHSSLPEGLFFPLFHPDVQHTSCFPALFSNKPDYAEEEISTAITTTGKPPSPSSSQLSSHSKHLIPSVPLEIQSQVANVWSFDYFQACLLCKYLNTFVVFLT